MSVRDLEGFVSSVGKDMNPFYALWFAKKNNPSCDIEKYQEIACQDPDLAYSFAADIPEADISYCQKHSCKTPVGAFYFSKEIDHANIEYCQEHVCKELYYACRFIKEVPESDIEYCCSLLGSFIIKESSFIIKEIKGFILNDL